MAEPRPGDFTCVPVSGAVGLGISVMQVLDGDAWSEYRHTEVYTGEPDAAGRYGYTVSTYPGGHGRRALPCPAAELPGSLWSSGLVSLTSGQRAGITAWALANQDTGYSVLDYGALVLHRLGIQDVGLRRYIASTRHQICSQFTDCAYLENDVHLFDDGRWQGYVTPGDLAGLLKRLIAAAADPASRATEAFGAVTEPITRAGPDTVPFSLEAPWRGRQENTVAFPWTGPVPG
jgi:hypothetical protein